MIQTRAGIVDDRSRTRSTTRIRQGALTVEQVIQKSSNVGAAKIALGLPPETMWEMFSEAGFGTPPKTGYPGEVAGRLRPVKSWKPIEQATMAYGHGISVNLVQLARAYTMFATDGEVKPATLFKTDGFVAGRPVLKPATALAVRQMLELATHARRHGAEGAGDRLSRRRQDRHRAQARRKRLREHATCRRSSASRPRRIRGSSSPS